MQRRAVRYKYSPTTTSILFGSRSVAHQVTAIGDPRTQVGVVTFELVKIGNEVSYEFTRPPAATVNVADRVIGYTEMSDEEIKQYADAWIKRNPIYNVVTNNCKHFASSLASYIIDPTLVEPEPGARYRFTRYHLKATSTVQFSGPQTGWILPSPETILVNVTQMKDDQDTWEGEVEGSGERGMFLRYTVEHA